MLNTLNLQNIDYSTVNLTGIRLLLIFSLLLDSPKTSDEINEYFKNNNYPNDIFSIDTLRNDINTLRIAGCEITRADRTNQYKYNLLSHPFELNIDWAIAESLLNLYMRVYDSLTIRQLISLENLFNKLSIYTKDEDIAEYLRGISLLKDINKDILKTLLKATECNYTVSFDYNAPYSGVLNYKFKICSLSFRSQKLYLNGYNITYNNKYSFLPIDNIISPITIHIDDDSINSYQIKVIYELKDLAMINFVEKPDEKIIEKQQDKLLVEYTANEYFKLNQKILEYGPNCTVIYPESVRNYTISTLKQMYEVYSNE